MEETHLPCKIRANTNLSNKKFPIPIWNLRSKTGTTFQFELSCWIVHDGNVGFWIAWVYYAPFLVIVYKNQPNQIIYSWKVCCFLAKQRFLLKDNWVLRASNEDFRATGFALFYLWKLKREGQEASNLQLASSRVYVSTWYSGPTRLHVLFKQLFLKS